MMQTHQNIMLLQQTIFGMLRRVIHDHSYQTHHTHEQALQLNHLPSPVRLLRQTAERLQQSDAQRRVGMPSDDLMHTLQWTHLADLIRLFSTLQDITPGSTRSPVAVGTRHVGPMFQCAHCEFCTQHVSVFRRHCTVAHQTEMNRTKFALKHCYAVNGLPTCRFCMHSFTTWRSFQIHLERGCQVLHSGPCSCLTADRTPVGAGITEPGFMPPVPAASRGLRLLTNAEMTPFMQHSFGPRVIAIMHDRTWHRILRETDACRYLTNRCFLCGTFFTRLQELNAAAPRLVVWSPGEGGGPDKSLCTGLTV